MKEKLLAVILELTEIFIIQTFAFLKENSIELLTAALVLVTAYYAWANRQMVKEMQKARELENNPFIKINLEAIFERGALSEIKPVDPSGWVRAEGQQVAPEHVEIINIGRGVAYNIVVTAFNSETKEKLKNRVDILKPGDSETPFFDEQILNWSTDVFKDKYEVIVEYENVLEEKFSIKKYVDRETAHVRPYYSSKRTEAEVLGDIHTLLNERLPKMEK